MIRPKVIHVEYMPQAFFFDVEVFFVWRMFFLCVFYNIDIRYWIFGV